MALLTRTWVGKKVHHYMDPETGKRTKVHHGETIKVTPSMAEAFDEFLIEPKVAEAQKAAKSAQEQAKAQVAQSKESDSASKVSSTSGS